MRIIQILALYLGEINDKMLETWNPSQYKKIRMIAQGDCGCRFAAKRLMLYGKISNRMRDLKSAQILS